MKTDLRASGCFFWTALLLGCPSPIWCQTSTTGALAGTVRNSAGDALPGVNVTLTDSATSQTQSAATGADGAYRFGMLAPGAYEARFAAPRFKTARLMPVTVNVSETPNLETILEPGDSSDVTECRCRLRTVTSSSGDLVDAKAITAVPLTTRNFTQVLSMSSGSAADVNNAGTLGRGTRSVNVNGNTSAGAYSLDGAFAPSAVPNPDTISELKIHTSQYDAIYGAQVPSTALITKSGEKDFHGDAWEFVRNDLFNANAFFLNATGQPKEHLKQNQYGGTLGGPVHRKKLFFFTSYQGTRQVNGLDQTSTANLLLPPLTSDRSAAGLAAAFCPANHLADTRYATFAGGKQLDCQNRSTAATAPINPVALKLLQLKNPDGTYYIPNPQTLLTSGLGFSSYSLPSTYNENQGLLNGDYLLTAKHTLAARGYIATIDQFRTFGSPQGYPGAAMVPGPGTPQALAARDYVASVNLTSAVSRSTVNESRFSFTRSLQSATGDGTPAAALFGMNPADRLFAEAPEITVLGPLGSFRLFGTPGNDFATANKYYSWSDTLAWVHGKHSLRAGIFLLTQANSRDDNGTARGRLYFQSFEDFLIGLTAADNLSPFGRSNIQTIQASEGAGALGQMQYRFRSYYAAPFLQDDVRVNSRLTLNLGLRWEYIGPASDTTGALGNFWPSLAQSAGNFTGNTVAANYDPNRINPYTGLPFGPPPAGVVVRPGDGYYRTSTPLNAFAPRVGLAWQPLGGDRLAVRGGYGWFYQSPSYSGNASGTPLFTSAPFAQGFSNSDSANNQSSLSNPFPATTLGFLARTATSQLSDRVAGPDYLIPRLQQWNLSAQVRLSKTLSLDAGYVGSYGDRLLISRGLNQPLLASAAQPVNGVTANTSLNASLRVPVLGETPTALGDSEFSGSSSYHSLQVTLRSRVWRGLSFQGNYTYSRAMNDTTRLNDQNNAALDWARAGFDRTHRSTVNFDYQLPAHGRLLSGWSLTGIVIVQSGLAMTLTDPSGGSVYGKAAASTVTLCPGATYQSLVTTGARLNHWINTAALCGAAVVGSDGSTGYGASGQSIMEGPGQFNTDFSLGKKLRVGGLREDALLAFRMEFYNALNHPQFANPGTTLDSATFGVITQQSVAPRLIQFAVKYLF
ncbi:MAG TPA: TonB-dependent receptor [Candidatus Sulfopaludibacter sp.]|jgi:hypothetical protein|nr:TonB-dependent receptor [Candidatus Sulfopaludibacter sp.]